MSQVPSLGRIVLVPAAPVTNNGAAVAPAVITRVWSDTTVNVRVLLDSTQSPEWRTSVGFVEDVDNLTGHTWTWPPRV